MLNGAVPALIAITPVKPDLAAVHCVTVRLPTVGTALMVMLNVLVTLAPTVS